MKDLIAKLEAATEGSRELDCKIFCATSPSPFESYYPDCVLAILGGFRARVEIKDIPHYTTSLDAALSLVPEGWNWLIHDGKGTYVGDFGGFASLHPTGQEMDRDFVYARVATPALALCIAALKAREATS